MFSENSSSAHCIQLLKSLHEPESTRSEKEKYMNVFSYHSSKGIYGVHLQQSSLVKVDSKEQILDHIYEHIQKEFKRVVKDTSKEI